VSSNVEEKSLQFGKRKGFSSPFPLRSCSGTRKAIVMLTGRQRTGLLASIVIAGLGIGATLGANGCSSGPIYSDFYCLPDANPDADVNGDCFHGDAGNGLEPQSCNAAGGECVEMGGADFRREAVLLWMGEDEYQAPKCPDRAPGDFYAGYGDLVVSWPCQECACGPAQCIMPGGMAADSANLCQGGNPTAYDGPSGWDGSCVSPAMLPAGSFHSIGLKPAGVSPCEPIGDPIPPKSPSFAPPRGSSFANGIYWGKYAKACQGSSEGICPNANDLCLPSAEPPPPGFRQCVQYTLPVDEASLPQCPEAFPDQFVFYSGTKGQLDCTPCQCGESVDAQCAASFSAYQDTTCAGVPMPLFKEVPAFQDSCVDFGAASVALGSMEAKWVSDVPGTCAPSGGELIGEVKGTDPRLFCCQAPPQPMDH